MAEMMPTSENESGAGEVDAIISRHMFKGWSLDGPALSRDEVNNILEKVGNEIEKMIAQHKYSLTSS